MDQPTPRMMAEDAVELWKLFEKHHIPIWVDGGWGADDLLGEQTRPHNDLDIAMLHKDVPLLRSLLEARGYKDVPRDDTWECNFILGDKQGRLIDVHSCTFDESGNKTSSASHTPLTH